MVAALLHYPKPAEVTDLQLTKYSKWTDRVWRFDDPTGGQGRKKIDWGRPLADGSSLLDPEWAPFLDTCRRLLWSLMTENLGGRSFKPGSLPSWAFGLSVLVDFMFLADYRHMTELCPAAIEEYIGYLQAEMMTENTERRFPFTNGSLKDALRPLWHMWQQAEVLAAAGAETLPERPFNGRSPGVVAGEILAPDIGTWPAVDDETFIATVNCLDEWYTYKGEDLIRLMDLVSGLEEAHGSARWYTSIEGSTAIRRELADFEFSTDPRTGQPWHVPLGTCAIPSHELRKLLEALKMACLLSVQSTTGMRISEVCGLNARHDHDGPFPSCIEIQSSACGMFDIFLICGRLFKTTNVWIDEKWVAGLRPKGSDHVPPPVRAICVLERVFRQWRREGNVHSLFVTMLSNYGLPAAGNRVSRQHSATLHQNRWIEEHVGIKPAVRVTSHQWRKAFARFLFRTDKRLLPAISLHLKHISLAMTELYVSGDRDLMDIIDSEATYHATELLYQMATGEKPLMGPVAAMILARCAELGHRLGNHAETEKREEISRIVKENGIRVWPLQRRGRQYGKCVFRPGVALCRAFRIGPLLRPDPVTANPELCAGCKSLAVDDGHAGFWLERLTLNAAIFEQNKDSDIGVAMLAQSRIDQSVVVLGWYERQFGVEDLVQ